MRRRASRRIVRKNQPGRGEGRRRLVVEREVTARDAEPRELVRNGLHQRSDVERRDQGFARVAQAPRPSLHLKPVLGLGTLRDVAHEKTHLLPEVLSAGSEVVRAKKARQNVPSQGGEHVLPRAHVAAARLHLANNLVEHRDEPSAVAMPNVGDKTVEQPLAPAVTDVDKRTANRLRHHRQRFVPGQRKRRLEAFARSHDLPERRGSNALRKAPARPSHHKLGVERHVVGNDLALKLRKNKLHAPSFPARRGVAEPS